jgi:hypothetical protein
MTEKATKKLIKHIRTPTIRKASPAIVYGSTSPVKGEYRHE